MAKRLAYIVLWLFLASIGVMWLSPMGHVAMVAVINTLK